MSVAGVASNKTFGVDGNPTAVTTSPSPKAATVLFQGMPAAGTGSPIIPHIKYGSKHPHPGMVCVGSPTVLVGGVALAFGTPAPTPTISCGDALVPAPATTCQAP